ncbi:MAG: M3 family oligoendopeptidase [Chloroflexi bacterium]|nr:M3 family oligoendopeptidase [Chloroflexota bacterium]
MHPQHPPTLDPLDWTTIQPHIDALLAVDLEPRQVREWLQRWSDLASVLDEAGTQIYREITENTADEEADARFKRLVTEIMPRIAQAEQALRQKLLAVNGYEPTQETAQLLRYFRAESDIFCEANIPILSELQLMGKQYMEIIGGLGIRWRGRTLTIPQAEAHLSDRDRTVREQVWRLSLDAYLAHRQELNDLFLNMLARRKRLAQNAGFPDFRAYQWLAKGRFDYTPEDCFIFHDAIEREVTPLATEIYRTLADNLNLPSLRPWELSISGPAKPTVDAYEQPLRPFGEPAELEEIAHRIFNRVAPAFGAYFAEMRDGYLDLESRPNKAPGGYCNSYPVSGKPYIFMNAAGTHRDVRTLMHEGGHAFHFAEAFRRQSLLWNYHGPMEFNEVASMAMELLSAPYWNKTNGGFYNEEDFARAYAEQLIDALLFLPYMAVVDALQHWLYVEAGEEVDAGDIDRKWSELWDRFLPGIDYSGLQTEKETGWHRKGHIFGSPFYYVEYGLAQLGALQIWRNALEDQENAVAAYRRALAAGYTEPLPRLFEMAGARFAFDREIVGELVTLVRDQLAQL